MKNEVKRKVERRMILLCGNIGSGKSTKARDLCDNQNFTKCVSKDAIRYMLGAGNYKFELFFEKAIEDIALYSAERLLARCTTVVIDDCNMAEEFRKPYIDIAKRHGAKVEAIVLPELSMEESVKRRLGDNHGNGSKACWESVWSFFHDLYQVPSAGLGS